MKSALLILALCALVIPAQAQSARQLTRRIAPLVPPPQHPASACPASPPPQAVGARPASAQQQAPEQTPAQKAESDKKTFDTQMKWAEKGSDSAQYQVGLRYLTGEGVEKNEKLGLEWLEKAAANGSSLARKKLAEIRPKTPVPADK